MSAADTYAERVRAVIAQRTRLRGDVPSGDPFADLPPSHPLLAADPRGPLDANKRVIAEYVQPGDAILDVGGGSGRYSLPLAVRSGGEVVSVDESRAMGSAFEANAERAGLTNARFVHGGWMDVEPLEGDIALVNHVLYLTEDIVPFLDRLHSCARRRVVITVNDPPQPSWLRDYFELVFDELEEIVPGHAELVNVLREMGVTPDVTVLPDPAGRPPVAPEPDVAIDMALARFATEQWAGRPLAPDAAARARELFEARFDELFEHVEGGYVMRWFNPGREVLITWET